MNSAAAIVGQIQGLLLRQITPTIPVVSRYPEPIMNMRAVPKNVSLKSSIRLLLPGSVQSVVRNTISKSASHNVSISHTTNRFKISICTPIT
jgi:hypothetical protein